MRDLLLLLALASTACFVDTDGLARPAADASRGDAGHEDVELPDAEPDAPWPDAGRDADADADPDGEEQDACSGLREICNGRDDDCDGQTDEDPVDGDVFCLDSDDDGVGDDLEWLVACAAPPSYLPTCGDCDDEDPAVYPGAEEQCNAVDDDCSGAADEEACSGCTALAFEDHTYQLCTDPLSWQAARDLCQAWGYDLAVIGDDEENDRLRDEARALVDGTWWIGLTDQASETVYIWVDGTTAWKDGRSLTFTSWHDGAPSSHEPEDCVQLDAHSPEGFWVDDHCTDARAFVCEAGG